MSNERFSGSPSCTYFLVSSGDDVDSQLKTLTSSLDDTRGIQSRVTIDDLLSETPYDAILRSAKIGSRYGKPLLETYLEEIEAILDAETPTIDALASQFDAAGADAYQAGVTGDILTMGLQVEEKVRERLDVPGDLQFTLEDLKAALSFAREESDSSEPAGTVLVSAQQPLSEYIDSQRIGGLSDVIQRLLLAGLDVGIVGSRGKAEEIELVRQQFRSIGSFSIEEISPSKFDVSDDVEAFVDEWYEQLTMDIADGRVTESAVRPASVTAYDLPESPACEHFYNAIVDGLQVAYTNQKLNDDRFEELWREAITPHENYDRYRSKYKEFPEVTIARTDGRTRTFRLTFQGPDTKPYIDGVRVDEDDPETAFVDLLERYLDATVLDEDRWGTVLNEIRTGIGSHLDVPAEVIAETAMLRLNRMTAGPRPGIPPEEFEAYVSQRGGDDRDTAWYREHWRTILSGPTVSTTSGTGIIQRKKNLCDDLAPASVADTALYHKLQRDIDNAWQVFESDLRHQLRRSLPAALDATITTTDRETHRSLRVEAQPEDGDPIETVVQIYLPFSDVRVDGEPVSQAVVPRVVSAVLDSFSGILYTRSGGEAVDVDAVLKATIRLYCRAIDAEPDELIYFEEIAEFALSLPYVHEAFQATSRSAEDHVFERLGSDAVMGMLRDLGVKFHRKGSDRKRGVKVKDDRYIAMELRHKIV